MKEDSWKWDRASRESVNISSKQLSNLSRVKCQLAKFAILLKEKKKWSHRHTIVVQC